MAAKEKENYKNRLQTIEKELVAKQKEQSKDTNIKGVKNAEDVIHQLKTQNDDLKSALAKMTAILRDKTGLCMSQEKKMVALTNQVDSLKEVVAITKDLLNIRNMEVQHLSNDISTMESRIDCERQRHNQVWDFHFFFNGWNFFYKSSFFLIELPNSTLFQLNKEVDPSFPYFQYFWEPILH